MSLDFLVSRTDLRETRIVSQAPVPLSAGQVRIRIDRFAFTANNVTYAAFGDAMSYWDFFPAPDGWGRIPVWGFGDVVESQCDAVPAGVRLYGYFPMSDSVVLTPQRISDGGFSDGAAHRAALHPVYNFYQRTDADPAYRVAYEDAQMLLKPLFVTSFLIDDFLADQDFFGARSVILSSASSKTAYGLAYQLSQRTAPKVTVIGLTSAANRAFTERLGCYDQVVTYEQIDTLPSTMAVVYVDMAGNGAVRATLHRHFQDQLRYSCAVGGTHWEQRAGEPDLPGPRPTLFFAPAQIKKRTADWGPAGLQDRLSAAWSAFLQPLAKWMQVRHGHGTGAVEQVYQQMLAGTVPPEQGHVLSLHVG